MSAPRAKLYWVRREIMQYNLELVNYHGNLTMNWQELLASIQV